MRASNVCEPFRGCLEFVEFISLAHKRLAENETGRVVLDGPVVASPPIAHRASGDEIEKAFLESLPLAAQPLIHLCALYQGWVECVLAFRAARISGRFALPATKQAAELRRLALADHERTVHEIARLRARARKESQTRRRIDLNLEIRRLVGELAVTVKSL